MSGSGCTNFSPGCTIAESFYAYVPSLAANATYTAIFALSFGLHIIQGFYWRKAWTGFAVAMALGTIGEVIGYVGRILNHINPFDQNGFLIQICCITIAPAFLSAGVYFCLGTIVQICDPSISRIPPRFYAYIFIPCDFASLVLQAVGGAMASIATTNDTSPDKGDNIMIAGVSFQVFTLSIFMLLSLDYFLRVRRSHWATEEEKDNMRLDSEKFLVRAVKLNKNLGLDKWNTVQFDALEARGLDRNNWSRRETKLFKAFLWALGISTIAIFIRCVYRVVEMSYGWAGVVIANQRLFIGFEGVCISVAVLILNLFHPGHCLKKPGVNAQAITPDHSMTHRISGIGGSSSMSTISELKTKSRFSLAKPRHSTFDSSTSDPQAKSGILLSPIVSDIPTTRNSMNAPSTAPRDSEDIATLDEEVQLRRPLSLADALRESRVDTMASTASAEGWVGQSLRDAIISKSVGKGGQGEKWSRESSMKNDSSLKSMVSTEMIGGVRTVTAKTSFYTAAPAPSR